MGHYLEFGNVVCWLVGLANSYMAIAVVVSSSFAKYIFSRANKIKIRLAFPIPSVFPNCFSCFLLVILSVDTELPDPGVLALSAVLNFPYRAPGKILNLS